MGLNGNHHLDGLIRGAVGSLAGLAAMGLFMKVGGRIVNGGNGETDSLQRHDALDDISLVGPQAEPDEPATEAVGRIVHEAVTGHDPDAEMKRRLGTAVHWGYGILLGGAYGAMRNGAEGADLLAGLGYGTAAWAIGDEVMVPMLGLAEGPTAHPWSDHLLALGAHLAYGAATAGATQALKRVM
jgi:hypothetical protein